MSKQYRSLDEIERHFFPRFYAEKERQCLMADPKAFAEALAQELIGAFRQAAKDGSCKKGEKGV